MAFVCATYFDSGYCIGIAVVFWLSHSSYVPYLTNTNLKKK
jgi:hypothetical protein